MLATIILLLITIIAVVDAMSVCDVQRTNVTAGNTPETYLIYLCTSLPFPTQLIAARATATSLNHGQSIAIGFGYGCKPDDLSMRFGDTCGGAKDKHVTCDATGFTSGKSATWCIVVRSLGEQPAMVSFDAQYYPASNEAQWHLNNVGQMGGVPGNDVNAEGAWSQGAFGNGIVIMITDSGVQMKHVEVAERFVPSLSWNPQTQTRDTTPLKAVDDHGTGCAGVAAAANNSYCGQGSAPMASIAGYRIFGSNYAADVAGLVRAMYYDEVSDDGRRVSVNSNSWGTGRCTGQGCYFAPMIPQVVASIQFGADHGRNGLGVVYTFAAGNEGDGGGDANMYPYCKLAEVMCIAASDFRGQRVFYSNAGANLFVNSPSLGQPDRFAGGMFPGIITAQLSVTGSTTNCMGNFGGTSSSTPLVSGIAALILSVRPDLTYRDVQHIIQRSADRNDPSSSTWFSNGAGNWYSHIYGFGRINAGNAVSLAKKWIKVGNVTGASTPVINVNQSIIDNAPKQPVISQFIFPSHAPGLPETIEHVMVYLTTDHPRPHDLRILLKSPYSKIAILALPQKTLTAVVLNSYPFAARTFWGESPVGLWTLVVFDEISGITGTLTSWSMEVTGNGTSASSSSKW